MDQVRVGFIGAGQMAQAIAKSIVSKGALQSSQILASAPSDRNKDFWDKLNIKFGHDNRAVYNKSDIIFLAMKPQQLNEKLYTELGNALNEKNHDRKIFVSLLAGVTLDTLTKAVHPFNDNYCVIRTAPNTPMQVGEGCCLYCVGASGNITPAELEIVDKLLSCGGICQQIAETSIDAFGALTGSGPAFMCLFLEGLSDGAVKMGIPRDLASKFAAQMALGTAKMVLESSSHIAQLRESVTSPGGMTICGLHVLERHNVRCACMDAIEAATKRSKELGALK